LKTGLQGSWDDTGINDELDRNTDELNEFTAGVKIFLYGMVGWLGILTVTSVIVFTVMYIRLDRTYRALEESDVCSISTASSRRSGILNIFRPTQKNKTPLKFYDSDHDAVQSHGTIKVAATDDECECENGSVPRTVTFRPSAAVHKIQSVTASDSAC